MYAVIDSKGTILARCDTYEDCKCEMETMSDFHPLDDKEIIDLNNVPKHLTMKQKIGILRFMVPEKNNVLRNFLEDMYTDHLAYLDSSARSTC